jgi:hypothetical protein
MKQSPKFFFHQKHRVVGQWNLLIATIIHNLGDNSRQPVLIKEKYRIQE